MSEIPDVYLRIKVEYGRLIKEKDSRKAGLGIMNLADDIPDYLADEIENIGHELKGKVRILPYDLRMLAGNILKGRESVYKTLIEETFSQI
jgi:hypothetical protein